MVSFAPDNFVRSDSLVAEASIDANSSHQLSDINKLYDVKSSYNDAALHENNKLQKTFSSNIDITDKKFHEAEDAGFNPVITDFGKNNNNNNWAKSLFGFNTDSWSGYYNKLRTLHYVAQAMTSTTSFIIANNFLSKNEENPDADKFSILSKDSNAQKLFYRGESILLTGVALAMTSSECSGIFDNFKLSLAAELGKDKEDLNMVDMFASENPIIKIERNRLVAKTVIRTGAGLSFMGGLVPGLLGAAAQIGAERTILADNLVESPYFILVKAVNEVQYNHYEGDVAQQRLVQQMQRALQGMYADQGKNVINEQNMLELRPVLCDVAQDIIDKRIGIESIFGILGGGIIVVDDAKQSKTNYDFVHENMMEVVADIAKQRREISQNFNILDNKEKIWDYNYIENMNDIKVFNKAATAHPNFVEKERAKINEQKFQNAGVGGSIAY